MDIEAFINSLRDSQTPAVRGVSRAYDMLPEGGDVEGGVKSVLPWLFSLANDARNTVRSYSQIATPRAGGGFEMYRDAGPAQAEATPLPAQPLPAQGPQPLRGGEVSVDDILALASQGDVITARGDKFGLSNDRSKGVSKYDDTLSEERYKAALLDPQKEAAADENMERLLLKIKAEADAKRPSREGQRAKFIENLITSVMKNDSLQPADYDKVLAKGMALFDSQFGGEGQTSAVPKEAQTPMETPEEESSTTGVLIGLAAIALGGRAAYKKFGPKLKTLGKKAIEGDAGAAKEAQQLMSTLPATVESGFTKQDGITENLAQLQKKEFLQKRERRLAQEVEDKRARAIEDNLRFRQNLPVPVKKANTTTDAVLVNGEPKKVWMSDAEARKRKFKTEREEASKASKNLPAVKNEAKEGKVIIDPKLFFLTAEQKEKVKQKILKPLEKADSRRLRSAVSESSMNAEKELKKLSDKEKTAILNYALGIKGKETLSKEGIAAKKRFSTMSEKEKENIIKKLLNE